MLRKSKGSFSHTEPSAHGDRPWVYFMIDSFFLVTQFFVLTFQLKSPDDLVLPHKLPTGGGFVTWPLTEQRETVNVSVGKATPQSQTVYSINGGVALSMDGVTDKFGELAGGGPPDRLSVRVSYDGKVNFGDVMPIFNTCAKLRIKQCGLRIPRDRESD